MKIALILLQATLGGGILMILAYLVVAILLFLLFRSVNLWYWKINLMSKTLEEIRDILKYQYLESDIGDSGKMRAVKERMKSDLEKKINPWTCPHCSTVNTVNESVCQSCGKSK